MNAIPQIHNFCCPSCGGFIGEAASIEQVRNSVTAPSQRAIFDMLSRRVGSPIMKDDVRSRVYGNRADGGPDGVDAILKTQVSRLRRKIEPFGWTISISRGGSGNLAQWRLIPTTAGA